MPEVAQRMGVGAGVSTRFCGNHCAILPLSAKVLAFSGPLCHPRLQNNGSSWAPAPENEQGEGTEHSMG